MWLTVPEPQRRGAPIGDTEKVPMREVLLYLVTHWRVFAPMFVGLAIGALAIGARQWYPEFYRRTYGWEPAYVGIVTGVSGIAFSLLGIFLGRPRRILCLPSIPVSSGATTNLPQRHIPRSARRSIRHV